MNTGEGDWDESGSSIAPSTPELSDIRILGPVSKPGQEPRPSQESKTGPDGKQSKKSNPPKPDLSNMDAVNAAAKSMQSDAPACNTCGHITIRSGTCYKCLNCGNSMGCS